MDFIEEKELNDYPKPVFIDELGEILSQMKQNVCKICKNDGIKGTGFFCKIPLSQNNKYIPVFIINNHVIDQDYLNNQKEIIIKLCDFNKIITHKINFNNSFKYTNKEYDITIIEIKEEKDNIYKFIELDENILDNTIGYVGNTIYTLHYPSNFGKDKVAVSFGILKNIFEDKKYNFRHFCSTEFGSSGAPILNSANNKIIGIHKMSSKTKQYNIGVFLKYPLKEFLNKYKQKGEKNESKNVSLGKILNKEQEHYNYQFAYGNENYINKPMYQYHEENFENKNYKTDKKWKININKNKSVEKIMGNPKFQAYNLNYKYENNYYINKLKQYLKKIFYGNPGPKEIEQLFLKLYHKGLVSDVILIQNEYDLNKSIDALKFICPNKNLSENWDKISKKWITAYHGTKMDYLESILEYGLQLPGTKLKNGTYVSQPKDIPFTDNVLGIKNWEKAIFASPNILYALDRRYSSSVHASKVKNYFPLGVEYSGDGCDLRFVLIVKIKPNSFTKHKSKIIAKFHKHHLFFIDEELNVDDTYRITSEKDIIVTSFLFLKYFVWSGGEKKYSEAIYKALKE